MSEDSLYEVLRPEEAMSLVEKQLRSEHPDAEEVRCEPKTGQGVIVLESGEEMVRAEFQSQSETYKLLKMYEEAYERT